MGLPGFLVAAAAIIGGSSGGGGGGGGGGDTAPTVPTPDDFSTWSSANQPDADFNTKYDKYQEYLQDDKFGLTEDQRAGYLPASVMSGFTNKRFATEADMKNADREAYNAATSGLQNFDSWLSGQDSDMQGAGYQAQYNAYRNQVNQTLNNRPAWMGEDDSAYKTFSNYDPGLFVAGEDYGDFAGAYRTRDEADSAFRNYYAEQIGNFGYGNLITDDMDNAGYVDAYNEAKSRNEFGTLISGLGYGSLVDPSMTSGQLSTLWDEVQERDRYKGLLDEMGYEYDATDDSTSLGYLYNQAQAIEDTKAKLKAAEDAYSALEGTYTSTVGDMEALQGEFDTLFGDYGSLTSDYGDLQGTYDTLYGQYGALEKTYSDTKEALGEKAGEYDTLSGLYDTLTSNYGTLTTDYNTAIGDLSTLQTNYDQLDKDKTALQGTYDALFGDYGALEKDYGALSGQFDALTSTQAKTQADLDASLADAQGLRKQKRMGQAVDFLTESAADKEARMASGFEPLQVPTQQEYTQAMDALGQTGLDPNAYTLAPIDFTGGFDSSVFQSTPMTGFAGPDAYGTTDYTNIFAGPQMGLQPMGLNVGQPFNPYFEALNQEYGVDFGLPSLGGQK